jgi:hypothetical protein
MYLKPILYKKEISWTLHLIAINVAAVAIIAANKVVNAPARIIIAKLAIKMAKNSNNYFKRATDQSAYGPSF